MNTCVSLSAMANYQLAWNAWSREYYYSNWTINRIPLQLMLAKQCLANEIAPATFNEIVPISTISQNTLLANGQYHVYVMAIFIVILLLGCRASTSISKDVDSVADLCKDFIALLKLLHWKNFDYTNIAFTTSCFMIFIALLPLLLTLWLCMLCYRQHIHFRIKVSQIVQTRAYAYAHGQTDTDIVLFDMFYFICIVSPTLI